MDTIKLYPHLKESTLSEATISEDVICSQNAFNFIFINNKNETIPNKTTKNLFNEALIEKPYYASNQMPFKFTQVAKLAQKYDELHNRFRIEFKQAIYSSANILGIHLSFKKVINITKNVFYINGIFRFISKCKYQIIKYLFIA